MASGLADLISSIFGTSECSGTSSSENQSAGVACSSSPTDVFHNLNSSGNSYSSAGKNDGNSKSCIVHPLEDEPSEFAYTSKIDILFDSVETITDHVNGGMIVENEEPHFNFLPGSNPNNQPGNPNELHQPVNQHCSCCVVTQNGGVFPQNGSCLLPNNHLLPQHYNTTHENHFVQQNGSCLQPSLNFDPHNVMNTLQSAPNSSFGACSSTSLNDGAPYRTNTLQNGPGCQKNCDHSQHGNIFHCPDLQNPTTASFNRQQRRTRTKFTQAQLDVLETEFISKQFISRIRRLELANQLNLSDKVIKIWFQNRRVRNKRQLFVEDIPDITALFRT